MTKIKRLDELESTEWSCLIDFFRVFRVFRGFILIAEEFDADLADQ